MRKIDYVDKSPVFNIYNKLNEMNNILLISEKTIKQNTEISDNLYGSYLLPAIRTSQDLYLKPIIGANLYNTILGMVADGSITASTNTDYKFLLDEYIQPYLLERVVADLVPIVSAKVANIGTILANDEHIVNLSAADAEKLQHLHIIKADAYCKELQRYLLANRELYPELEDCACDVIKANLDSAASTGIWLGGLRNPRH